VQPSWAGGTHGPVAAAVKPRFDALSTIAGSARHLLLSDGSPCRPSLPRLLREDRSMVAV
jgi:hypothetical protein